MPEPSVAGWAVTGAAGGGFSRSSVTGHSRAVGFRCQLTGRLAPRGAGRIGGKLTGAAG